MAKQIPEIGLTQFKNAQHDEFMTDVLEEALRCAPIMEMLPTQLSQFQTAAETEHRIISTPLKFETSPEILEKDRQRDHALSILRSAMRAQTGYPEAAVAQAAEVVQRMSGIDKISGSEQYDEQTGKVSEMITVLLGTYRQQVETAMLLPFVLKLKELNDQMCQLLIERDRVEGERGPRQTAEARQTTDAAYRALMVSVNAVSLTIDLGVMTVAPGGSRVDAQTNPFIPFIEFMCGIISRYKREVLKVSSTTTKPVEGEVTDGESIENEGSGSGSNTGGGSGSTEEGGSTEGGSGSNTGGGSGSTETPTDPTKILLLFNDGAHGNVIVKRMEVEPGYQLTSADLPDGYVYAFKADDQADIDAASPGDTVWVPLSPRG